jgi:hypothetical protein
MRFDEMGWFWFTRGLCMDDREWIANVFAFSNLKYAFVHCCCNQFGLGKPTLRYQTKNNKGRCWCSQDSLVQPEILLPFHETVALFCESELRLLTLVRLLNDGSGLSQTVKTVFSFVSFSCKIDSSDNQMIPPPGAQSDIKQSLAIVGSIEFVSLAGFGVEILMIGCLDGDTAAEQAE